MEPKNRPWEPRVDKEAGTQPSVRTTEARGYIGDESATLAQVEGRV